MPGAQQIKINPLLVLFALAMAVAVGYVWRDEPLKSKLTTLTESFIGREAKPALSSTVILNSWQSGLWAEAGCETVAKYTQANHDLIFDQDGCKYDMKCSLMRPRWLACAGVLNAKAEAHSFEDRLVTRFATDPNCKGASLKRFYEPSDFTGPEWIAAIREPHWELDIDYDLGVPVQRWSLGYGVGGVLPYENTLVKSEGKTPGKIADDICTIVLKRGGRIGL